MSSARGGGGFRGRARGNTALAPRGQGRGRGASAPRGRVFSSAPSQRGTSNARGRGAFGHQPPRGIAGQAGRGSNNTRGNAFTSAGANTGGAKTRGTYADRYDQFKIIHEEERQDAIKRGLIADPDKPRALSDAITPVGTCQDMCPERERVQRIHQDDTWAEECGPDGQPDESRMVKKFRRAAAGIEEQLPSELRSPPVLKRTCDYLFDEVIGNAPSLARVHHFVWDRTRAIRNDFSIQQLSKLEDLRIAVECYERIARFHILSLHQLASPERPYAKYDWPQEREQLDRTLLSLIQLYEDTRGRIEFENEAEFRAYCVIFQLRSPTPDLEDNVQAWPRRILRDQRVRKALDVYAAGCTVMRPQGPLNPKASHLIARQDWQRVWVLLASNEVSYLMGCTAEVYFNSIRQTVLNALFRTFRANTTLPTTDWTLDTLCELFAFDDEEELQTYCQYFGFAFKARDDGQQYLDLSSVAGRTLPLPNPDMPNQLKSSLVENKRLGRTLPSVIDGMSVRQAQDAGLVVEEEDDGMEDVDGGSQEGEASMDAEQHKEDDGDSLFIPETEAQAVPSDSTPALTNGLNAQPKPSPFSWGKPSETTQSPFAAPAQPAENKPKFDFLSGATKVGEDNATGKTGFNFLSGALKPAEPAPTATSGFDFLGAGNKTSAQTAESKPAFNFSGSIAPTSTTQATPKLDFTSKFQTPIAFGEAKSGDERAAAKATTTETATQPNGLFSKPSQETSGAAPSPFLSATPSPTAKPSGLEQHSAAPSLFTSKPPKSATVEDAPFSPDSPQNPFLQPPASISTAKSPETTPSFPNQPGKVQPQPPQAAPATNAPPAFSNSPPSPPQLNTGLRRPSTSTDNKPKKPSPLSHSFTAGDDSSATSRDAPASAKAAPAEKAWLSAAPPRQPSRPSTEQANAAAAPEQSHVTKPVPFKKNKQPAETFDDTVSRIAKELVNDPVSGYLKQYVEYKASQVITSVQEEIAAEKMKIRLSELRMSTIYRKYLKRWISLIWQRRLAKSGKDRRQRRRKRLEDGFDDGSSYAGDSVSGSRPASVVGSTGWKDHREQVDAMFQRTVNSKSLAHPAAADQQARAGRKRPSSSHGENGLVARASAHKRMKSTSHVDDRGRITKPTATSHPNDDLLKRSSFLGFSVNGTSPPTKDTTKSNYFRLKAMGVHRADELSAPRGAKRSRTESVQPSQTSPPHLRSSMSGASSPEESTTRSLMPPPSSTQSRAQKAREEDDALFARIRAARESLTIGTAYMRQEVERDDGFQRSRNSSQSSNDSPSMIKARADARARASRSGSQEHDVPAYRLRESRFVAREQYGRAIEKAKEMRESRSRESSRPVSRFEHRADATFAPGASTFSFSTATDAGKQSSIPNGLPTAKSPASSTRANEAPRGFSPLEGPGLPSFANHTTEMSNQNPFLQSNSNSSILAPTTSGFGYSPAVGSFGPGTSFGGLLAADQGKDMFGPPAPAYGSKTAFGSQNAHSAQATGSGFGPTFGAHPAATQKSAFGSPFGSASKPTFGSQTTQLSFAAPQDQTIQPELIDQSLENSFGSQEDHGHDVGSQLNDISIPPQQKSYMNTQPISLLSDDEEGEEQTPAVQPDQYQPNGLGDGEEDDEEILDEEETEEETFVPPYGSANPFAVLADQNNFDEFRSQSQAEENEMYDQDQFDDEEDQRFDDGFQSQQDDFTDDGNVGFDDQYYSGEAEEDEEGMDGDVDEEGEGFDEEDEDDEEEEEEDEDNRPAWQKNRALVPPPHPALQGMGKTEDAPIELDSD